MSGRQKFLVIFGLTVCTWVPLSAALLILFSDLTVADVSNTLMEMFS